jgi:type I restriction enzyme S subunit
MSEGKKSVPKLRFPEFRGGSEWKSEKVDNLVDGVTPPKKLPTSSYSSKGDFPIIDQSQSQTCGWTDDRDALIRAALPLIVFGDHTCVLKLVDRPFAQGADGIKILRPRSTIDPKFLYQFLSYKPVTPEEYKRHFSILKEKLVLLPNRETGEQHKIADCLDSLDQLIASQTHKVNALRSHKSRLLSKLFPRAGESRPQLRFPQYRDAPAWRASTLGNTFETTSGGTPNRSEPSYWGGDIPWITTSLVNFGVITNSAEFITEEGLTNSSAKLLPKGTVLIAMYGQGKTRGKVALLGVEAATNQACAAVLSKAGIDSRFVFQSLAGRYEELRRLSNSGGQENLSQGLIRGLSFAYPENEDEQRQIADCLFSLEDLIAAAVQGLDALKAHKKGLMQRLFPITGEV